MAKIVRTLIIACCLIYLLAGCYDPRELDDLAYVIAIGIDKGDEKDLKVTFQIAIPVNISGEGSSTGQETSTLLTVDSNSVYGAVSQANTEISKEINLSQNKMIVFSEELAKEGLEGYINPFVTNKEIRPRTSIVICKSTAKEFLTTITPILEPNPARYLDLMLSSHSYSGFNVGTELVDFYWNVQSKYTQPIAILAKPKENSKKQDSSSGNSGGGGGGPADAEESTVAENSTPVFIGIAAFSGTTMVGELLDEEVIPHLILTNTLSPANFEVPDINDETKTTTVTISQKKRPQIELTLENDIPKIKIVSNVYAQLLTTGTPANFFEAETRYKLAKEIEEKLKTLINDYLEKTKEFKTDITGFGKLLKPQYWTIEELEKIDWHEIYPNAEFDITVNVNLDASQIVSYTEETEAK
ncbi:MAG: Ger(x)C family spore germination protein [Clostridia bacterium]|nr:Ger(x)C family spore germination protein [Clostridia bacterium]